MTIYPNIIQLRETCHSEAVTDVTAVGIRIQNVRENGLPRQSADWLAMTKPLTEWHCYLSPGPYGPGDFLPPELLYRPKIGEIDGFLIICSL